MVRSAVLLASMILTAPAWALTPQTALPRPIVCGTGTTRAALPVAEPDARCPQWLSTGGIIPKRTLHRG